MLLPIHGLTKKVKKMARQMDTILVVDVESTCWEKSPPAGQVSEIIEIGLCTLDVRSLTRIEKRSILVKPVLSEIGRFCTELTTLTSQMFTTAGSLAEAAQILRDEYHSQNRLWASWGDYDRLQFEKTCDTLNVDYPFGRTHLNVKSLFAATRAASETGLARAMKQLGLKMEGTHHRGDDDAWNIAMVLSQLLNSARRGICS